MIASTNIASYLPVMAKQQPDALAVAVQTDGDVFPRYTYKELEEASDVLARGLQEAGIVRGTRTVLMVKPSLEFFALVFALFKMGAVMVAVDPGIGIKNLGKCLGEAEPEAFIGIPQAHIARLLFGWARQSIKIRIWVGARHLFRVGTLHLDRIRKLGLDSNKSSMNETEAEETAAILFTSGSTGVPKGVIYTHANFIAQVRALQSLYRIQPGEVDLATFPLFALYAPAMGMTSIVPDMDFTRPGSVDPARIFAAVDQYKATTMFGSPALLNRVGRWGVENNKKLSSLKRVLSAGAPVSPATLERFSQLLETGVEIYTPYGATESLPVSSIGSNEVLQETGAKTGQGRGVCIGRVVDGIDVYVIGITDEVIKDWSDDLLLPANQVGEIVVHGPQVTKAYYNREESTALAKIHDAEGNVYHRMGDLGYQDEQGRLWFCGRKSHRIATETDTLYSVCCEGVFNVHPQVNRTALVELRRNGRIVPGLCVELEPGDKHTNRDTLKEELLQLGSAYEHTQQVKEIFFHPAFPVDIRHNAKIDRTRLGLWAQKK